MSKVLSDINVDIKSSNETLEKKIKNETNAWMKGLKERVIKGKEVFRGSYVRIVCLYLCSWLPFKSRNSFYFILVYSIFLH